MSGTHLQFVIEPKFDIRHATQEHLHDNLAIDIAPQHRALVTHEHVDLQDTANCQGAAIRSHYQAGKWGLLLHKLSLP